MKVNHMEKDLFDKNHELNRLQEKVEHYQKVIFIKFDSETHKLTSDMRCIQKMCTDLTNIILNVKEDFDRMWLSPTDSNRTDSVSHVTTFLDDGGPLQSVSKCMSQKSETKLDRQFSSSDDSLDRMGAAAARSSAKTFRDDSFLGNSKRKACSKFETKSDPKFPAPNITTGRSEGGATGTEDMEEQNVPIVKYVKHKFIL